MPGPSSYDPLEKRALPPGYPPEWADRELYYPKTRKKPYIWNMSTRFGVFPTTIIRVDGQNHDYCRECAQSHRSRDDEGVCAGDKNYKVGLIYDNVYIGHAGEMAAALWFKLPVDLRYKETRVAEPDGFFPDGTSYDVKTQSRRCEEAVGWVRYCTNKGWVVPLKSDYYIFALYAEGNHRDRLTKIAFFGYMTRDEVKRCRVDKARRSTHKDYFCPYKDMHPIEELKTLVGLP